MGQARLVWGVIGAVLLLGALTALPALWGLSSVGAPVVRPYPLIPVKVPDPLADESFAAFRAEIAAIAKRRVYSELAALVVRRGFFWERDFGSVYDRNKPGVENLAVAISLERGNGGGWTALATFAAEPTAEPLVSRPGVICAPAQPQFDEAEFGVLLGNTQTETAEWLYAAAEGVAVRSAARPDSEVIETLGTHFVRLWTDEGKTRPRSRAAWARVVTPQGKIGFVAPDALISLSGEGLCYARDVTGRWHIVGYIGPGDR